MKRKENHQKNQMDSIQQELKNIREDQREYQKKLAEKDKLIMESNKKVSIEIS